MNLVRVYGTEAVCRKYLYYCFKRFRHGKETTEDLNKAISIHSVFYLGYTREIF